MENHRDIEIIREIYGELKGDNSKRARRIKESLIRDIEEQIGELQELKILLGGDLE